MLTVYGVYRSRAARIFWLAGELGLKLRQVPVIQGNRLANAAAKDAPLNTASPEFLAISPAGAVPCIDDDGLVLSESLAITLYLAKKHGGPLAAADTAEAALMLQWTLYGVASVEAPALAILYAHAEGRAATPEGRAEVDASAEKLRRPLQVIDSHLAVHGHLVGRRFTVADINMAEMVRYAQAHPTLVAGFPALAAWLKACQSRPAFKAMWEKRNAEPA